MKRRGVLLTLAAASGCLAGGPFDGPPDESADAPRSGSATEAPDGSAATADAPVRVERFVGTERCPSPGDAAVRIADADVVVAGCLRGANGCAVPVLSAAAYDAAADALTVIVGTDARDDADACTEVRTRLGYRARVALVEGPPDAVSVVHDDADGHREVVRRGAES